MKNILTIKEAAEYLRVSRSTVWRWCRDGSLSTAFKAGRNWRIHRSEVERMIGQKLIQAEHLSNTTNELNEIEDQRGD